MAAATASQAWAILTRHARDEIGNLRLQELCHDTDRVSSLVAVHNTTTIPVTSAAETHSRRRGSGHDNAGASEAAGEPRILLADLSRQRMTTDTLSHLLRLASARGVRSFIRRLAWGQNDRNNPIVPQRVRRQQARNTDRHAHDGDFPVGLSASPSMKKTRFVETGSLPGTRTGGPGSPDRASAAGMGGAPHGNQTNTSPSMHMALRAPANQGLEMLTADGINALDAIHLEWGRISRLSETLRRGQLRGATGSVIRDVIVVGQGTPVAALRFLYEALKRDEMASRCMCEGIKDGRGRRMEFISSPDPLTMAATMSDLDPASTLVITIALRGDEETNIVTRTLKNWLIQGLGARKRSDLVVSKHMILVTANEKLKATKPETVFLLPEHSRCEAFTTFTAAGLLPLSLIFGWNVVEQILAGAHDLDKHFVETNPRHNLPVLLALTDVWNDAFLGSSGRVLTPFSEAFSAFPSFVATLEAQTCGNRGTMDRSGRRAGIGKRGDGHDSCAAMVIDGGLRGDHDRALYQCGRPVASELITSMDTQAAARTSKIMGLDGVEEAFSNQDALLCSFFAHADVLAFGSEDRPGGSVSSPRTLFPSESFGSVVSNSVLPYSSRALAQSESFGSVASNSVLPVPYSSGEGEDIAEGNRPSTLLVCGICDAFTCGQLIALSEHRAAITARIWDVDPFAKGVGSSLRLERTEHLKNKLQQIYERMSISSSNHSDQAEDSTVNLATATILGHYATMMHDRKMYVVRGNS